MTDKAPQCKVCGQPHWLSEPHVYPLAKGEGSVIPSHCPECVTLRAEVAMLKRKLAEANPPEIKEIKQAEDRPREIKRDNQTKSNRGGPRPGAGRKPRVA